MNFELGDIIKYGQTYAVSEVVIGYEEDLDGDVYFSTYTSSPRPLNKFTKPKYMELLCTSFRKREERK